jgi:Domain of unknown function (DUF4062)
MDKRYQVFVSSTYADLQEERQEVMQALLELDCIPAGMELFPAANEDQWTLIKKVIDDCDYYMVIVAGRYGSIGPDGFSFTEMEYRYALDQKKPVLGFVHREPGKLAASRCETGDDGKAKLTTFRDFVQKKMCRFWESPADLGSQVSRSLVKLIKREPGIGWVRGDLVPNESAAEEMLGLRRQIEQLQAQIQASRTAGPEGSSQLAQGDELFELDYNFVATKTHYASDGAAFAASTFVSWNDIFSAVCPLMIHECGESDFLNAINAVVYQETEDEHRARKQFEGARLVNFKVSADDFQTIKVQLRALGLITKSTNSRSVKDTATYWTLTPYGDNAMTRLRAIRKSDAASADLAS